MSEENFPQRLKEHKTQLRSVEKLLQKDPANQTLADLQKDLINVIAATEKFIKTKSLKAARNASSEADKKLDASPEKKAIPREWGVYKNDWKAGERCQVMYTDRRWYMAEISEIDAENTASLILLDNGNEHAAPCKRLRTYVPMLREDVQKDSDVKAIWEFDGLFYDSKVVALNEDGTFQVLFEKYNHKDNVRLEDIQPKPKKQQRKTAISFRDEDGHKSSMSRRTCCRTRKTRNSWRRGSASA
ncbi:Survival of motor neuron-related-splicing factor 30 [Bonamia ostreae]|uniref:Survival of motor neuron-related-splicing factor 30 n=1 Tax=Bonamia ostreae TaxID=126728 RepID=A0ABV2AFU3_9EUKA